MIEYSSTSKARIAVIMSFSPALLFRSLRKKKRHKAHRVVYDSDPRLKAWWCTIRLKYFPDLPELDEYVVTWSKRRQKRVLASCNIVDRRVLVAQELKEPSAIRWLDAILYHEMCHAAIGKAVPRRRGQRSWHGPEFKGLEARHPDIPALNLWIRTGGWTMAVRSHRARVAWVERKAATRRTR